ncbi:MAG TPA: hypothetical protein VMU90_07455 [Solirubrobacteraceae bacterium]|nr:hypothetical protein [Solirubrobacteraceae bacterium]
MRATMLLCDAAQETGGKLYIIGAGWSALLEPDTPTTQALAVVLHIEWTEANSRHPIEIELHTDDGEVWEPAEGQPLRMTTEVEVGRPPGVKPGTELNAPLAATFNGLVLPSGGYVWILRTGETLLARWPFSVGVPRQ